MARNKGARPEWLTFDCYGTLIQWDEGLQAAVARILFRHGADGIDPRRLIAAYDHHEHALEAERPHRSFRSVSTEGLRRALADLGLPGDAADGDVLTSSISAMPPFPEIPGTLRLLKAAGFRLCIISNTDDAIIAGNVAQMGPPGTIDRVITAEQAGAYKPSRQTFEFAHRAIGVTPAEVCHICASPHLDLTAARDIGFRCIWVDRGTGRKAPPGYDPDAVIPSLEALPPLLRDWAWLSGP